MKLLKILGFRSKRSRSPPIQIETFEENIDYLPSENPALVLSHQELQEENMDSLLTAYPALVSLSKNLSHQELKSLSLVSRGWREATDLFLINRSFIRFVKYDTDKEIDGIEFFRKYKHVKIQKYALQDVLPKVPDSLVSLDLDYSDIEIEDFKKLQRFKRLKRLTISYCEFHNIHQLNTKDLGLQYLEVRGRDEYLPLFQDLIAANGSIKSLVLSIFLTTDDFKSFLRTIQLPKLQEISISVDGLISWEDALRTLFQNHKDLRSCTLDELKVKDEDIAVLRKSCENLEKVSLKGCEELTGRTLNELNLMRMLKHLDLTGTKFHGDDLKNLNPRQLEFLNITIANRRFNIQIQPMLMQVTNVRVLKLSCGDFFQIPDSSILPIIAEKMPNLVDLTLSGFSLYCDDEVKEISRSGLNFERLEKLEMSVTQLTAQLPCLINAPKLRVLLLDRTRVSSEGIRHLVNNSPLIEELKLLDWSPFEADVSYITKNLLCLRVLDIKDCQIGLACFQNILTNTSIERCFVSTYTDLEKHAKLKEGFVWKWWTISNGARSILFSFKTI